MRCFLIGVAGFVVTAVLAAVAIASYGDYAARASLAETMTSVVALRTQIAEGLVTRSGLPIKVTTEIQAFPNVDYLKVTNDGAIVFRSAKHGQVIVLEPSIAGGAVSWRCIGAPAKDVPADCR
jgi:Tfp pilus assembly major pilin PilA